ncbi:hypothetical protein BQ8482_180013 [Mesorhizobium delmotii]|uniref:Uncharacterized protein n=1 Tax=Mesorhizobium delmotii TaxID=1631247 RepID=A0A2P9AI37_9HYPH|nr:hypothetical protein BQ8482_180013 [Mesorhizobium delmotii]
MLTSTGAEIVSGLNRRMEPALLTRTLVAPNGAAADSIASWQARTISSGTPGSALIGLTVDGLLMSLGGWRLAGRSSDRPAPADRATLTAVAAVVAATAAVAVVLVPSSSTGDLLLEPPGPLCAPPLRPSP